MKDKSQKDLIIGLSFTEFMGVTQGLVVTLSKMIDHVFCIIIVT